GRMPPPTESSLPPMAHSLAGPRPARQLSTAYSRAIAAASPRASRPRTQARVFRARRCKARAASSSAQSRPLRAKSGRPAAGRRRRTWSSVSVRGEPAPTSVDPRFRHPAAQLVASWASAGREFRLSSWHGPSAGEKSAVLDFYRPHLVETVKTSLLEHPLRLAVLITAGLFAVGLGVNLILDHSGRNGDRWLAAATE